MAENRLVITGIGEPGGPDAELTVTSHAWTPGVKQLMVSSQVSRFSAQLAVVQLVDDVRDFTLTCFDDAGQEFLRYTGTGARIRGYGVFGSTTDAHEQFTLEFASLEMVSGGEFAANE